MVVGGGNQEAGRPVRRQEQLPACNRESCKVSVLLPFIQEDFLGYLKPQ